MYLTLFVFVFLIKFFKKGISLVVLLLAIISRVVQLILVKLFVFIIIRQGAPLGLAVQMN